MDNLMKSMDLLFPDDWFVDCKSISIYDPSCEQASGYTAPTHKCKLGECQKMKENLSAKSPNKVFDDEKTTNMMYERLTGIFVRDKDGKNTCVMPRISDVKAVNDRVVIITFEDGTKEKAVLAENDTFSLEQGISICITKKLLDNLVNGCGSSVYNKLIDYALKRYYQEQEWQEKKKEILAEATAQTQKREAKRQKRLDKVREKDRQEMIDILAEAIKKAMGDSWNIKVEGE